MTEKRKVIAYRMYLVALTTLIIALAATGYGESWDDVGTVINDQTTSFTQGTTGGAIAGIGAAGAGIGWMFNVIRGGMALKVAVGSIVLGGAEYFGGIFHKIGVALN